MKFRSTTGKSSLRFPSQLWACACATPISSASSFELSEVPCQARRAARSPRFPGEKLALRGNPIAQLAPSPEDRLSCARFGVCLATLGCCRDEQAVGMIGKLGHQPPFLVCELRAGGAPARRLLALAHGGKLQGENAGGADVPRSDGRRGMCRRDRRARFRGSKD